MVQQPMTTDVLTLAQMLSPSFPVGAFAYSHGLETAIDQGLVTDADSLQMWLNDLLLYGSGYGDAVLLNMAFAASASDIQSVDMQARAVAATKERLQETDLQGAAFCVAANALWSLKLRGLTYPVAIGYTARALGFDPELTTAMYLQAFVGNLCGVAMRAVPLGQTDGQQVQKALQSVCLDVARKTQGAGADDLHSSTFMSDIVAMQHETKYARVFRT